MNNFQEIAWKAKSTKKITSLTPSEWNAIWDFFYKSLDLSTRNAPTEQDYVIVSDYVIRYFKHWHAGELKAALEYNIQSDNPIKSASRFSTQLISGILNKWEKEIRNQTNKILAQREYNRNQISQANNSKYTAEYMVNRCIEHGHYSWKEDYNFFGAEGVNKMYEYLESIGKIKLSPQQKLDLISAVKEQFETEKRAKITFKNRVSKLEEKDLKTMCRKIVLRKYFDEQRLNIKNNHQT